MEDDVNRARQQGGLKRSWSKKRVLQHLENDEQAYVACLGQPSQVVAAWFREHFPRDHFLVDWDKIASHLDTQGVPVQGVPRSWGSSRRLAGGRIH